MRLETLKIELKEKSSHERALKTMSFFKTGKGQYSEGDIFLGVSSPDIRMIAKNHKDTPMKEILKLLKSPIHEERLLALVMMVNRFRKGDMELKRKMNESYFQYRTFVNNWDLVDVSAPTLLGSYCYETMDHRSMDQLIISRRHWDRRIAMVATLSFIRIGTTELTYQYAKKTLNDKEDLMHKATGWMLREAGKKNVNELRSFIKLHGKNMPRTMLRYAIEKFDDKERLKILVSTKS